MFAVLEGEKRKGSALEARIGRGMGDVVNF
jgi:hypothetical protein